MYVLYSLKFLGYTSILLTINFQETEADQKGTKNITNRSYNKLWLQSSNLFKNDNKKKLINMSHYCCLHFY